MVSGDTDAVEPGHFFGCKFKDIRDNFHGHFRWVDIGVPDHEFFQDIVLDGSVELLKGCSLFQSGHNIEGHDGKYGPIHGHGYRHLVKRDLVEKDLHIQNGINGHPRLPHISHNPFVVGIIAPVSGQVEGHG